MSLGGFVKKALPVIKGVATYFVSEALSDVLFDSVSEWTDSTGSYSTGSDTGKQDYSEDDYNEDDVSSSLYFSQMVKAIGTLDALIGVANQVLSDAAGDFNLDINRSVFINSRTGKTVSPQLRTAYESLHVLSALTKKFMDAVNAMEIMKVNPDGNVKWFERYTPGYAIGSTVGIMISDNIFSIVNNFSEDIIARYNGLSELRKYMNAFHENHILGPIATTLAFRALTNMFYSSIYMFFILAKFELAGVDLATTQYKIEQLITVHYIAFDNVLGLLLSRGRLSSTEVDSIEDMNGPFIDQFSGRTNSVLKNTFMQQALYVNASQLPLVASLLDAIDESINANDRGTNDTSVLGLKARLNVNVSESNIVLNALANFYTVYESQIKE